MLASKFAETNLINKLLAQSIGDENRIMLYEKKLRQVEASIQKIHDEHAQFIDKQIITDIVTYFAVFVDNEVIKFLDQDLKKYRIEKRLDASHLTPAQSQQALLDYYKERNNIKEYMFKNYPVLEFLLNRLTEQYLTQMCRMLNRVIKDRNIIGSGFNPNQCSTSAFDANMPTSFRLISVAITDSDRHRGGAQVVILTFSFSTDLSQEYSDYSVNYCNQAFYKNTNENLNKNIVKVVYKPSPVECDALIMGDIDRLRAINLQYGKDYENHFSFISIINEALKDNKLVLPTYLIVPCFDNSDTKQNDIERYYGYLEYLKHHPWKELNYKQILTDIINSKRDEVIDNNIIDNELRKKIRLTFESLLREAATDMNCDYIVRSANEKEQYAYDCGCLVAMMVALGITDMHVENLIVSQRRPVLIDLECCFTMQYPSIGATLAFAKDIGSHSQHSMKPITSAVLMGVNGCITRERGDNIKQIDKNRLFYLYEQQGDELIACHIDPDKALKGFGDIINILKSQQGKINQWFNLFKVQHMYVRSLPHGTGGFRQMIDELFEENYSQSVNMIKSNFVDARIKFSQNLLKRLRGAAENKRKLLAIFMPNYAESLFYELVTLNIPTYHIRVNDCQLYDFNAKIINFPIFKCDSNSSTISAQESKRDVEVPSDGLLSQTPIDYIINNLAMILNDVEKLKDLQQQFYALLITVTRSDGFSDSDTLQTVKLTGTTEDVIENMMENKADQDNHNNTENSYHFKGL